jgi:hypothetical protein
MEELVSKIARSNLPEEDRRLVIDLIYAVRWMNQSLEEKSLSIERLKKIFGIQTEKASHLFETIEKELDRRAGPAGPAHGGAHAEKPVVKPNGHGRLSADDYTGARKIDYPHPTLKAGMRCPGCERGKLCALESGKFLRIIAVAPLQAVLHQAERLRCATCGELYRAELPEEVGTDKFDASACAMVALFRYGYGFPMNRLAHFQKAVGVPLPVATQWDLIKRVVEACRALFAHMIYTAAQGELFHNDDTTVKILDLMKKHKEAEAKEEKTGRTGMFTTAIISKVGDHKMMLFFSGRAHAGENLEDLLARRKPGQPVPLQMCDALSRNEPAGGKTEAANCLTHARRNFYEVYSAFPIQVSFVLEILRGVYRNDAMAKEKMLSPAERLAIHQNESAPLMEELRTYLENLIDRKQVEPNSSLGKAIQYLKNHWPKLTCFLRVPGAPLTNDDCERLLKTAIRHRRNSLFYKTEPGAEAGDILMSVIQTAIHAGINPFVYLMALQKNKTAVEKAPEEWLPWNYETTLASQSPLLRSSSP